MSLPFSNKEKKDKKGGEKMFDEETHESEFMDMNREIDFSFEDEEDIDEEEDIEDGLVKTNIEQMITPQKIKPVLMDEKTQLEEKAVMIDLTHVTMITEESLRAIKYLVKEDGDMDIILKVGENKRGIGKGDSLILYELIPQMIEQLYNKEAKVSFKRKNDFVPHNRLDASIVRLKLF